MTRDHALQITREWVKNENLIRHLLAVEAALRFYACKYGENEERWGNTGLLHDADWEKYPDEHPQKIMAYLKENREDPTVIHAINAHGGKNAVEPVSLLDKMLCACDELSGFVVAVALMRPTKLAGMEAKSVVKKMKDKSFAANVNRDDIVRGAKLLDLPLEEHIKNVIEALQGVGSDLNL